MSTQTLAAPAPRLQPEAYARTIVPVFLGLLIAKLVAAIPVVGEVILFVDTVFAEAGYVGVTVIGLLNTVITALVVLAYYWLANLIARRFPLLSGVLTGSSVRPVYPGAQPAERAIPATADVEPTAVGESYVDEEQLRG